MTTRFAKKCLVCMNMCQKVDVISIVMLGTVLRYSNAEDSAGWFSTLNYIVHIPIHVRLNLLV